MADSLAPLMTLLTDIQARLANLEASAGVKAPASSAGAAPAAAAVAESAGVKAYNTFIADFVNPLIAASDKLGSDEGKALGKFLERGFKTWTLNYITMASQNKKPKDMVSAMATWRDELTALIKEVSAFRDNRSEYAHLMNAVNEAVQAVSWTFVDLPKPFVESYLDGTLFWSNKVRVANKRKGDAGANFVVWCDALRDMLKELVKYVKAEHTTGVTFNPRGGENYGAAAAPAAAPAAAAPKKTVVKPSGGGGGMSDIFAGIKSIDQSSGKTAGLKKVLKSEMTHKNAALRKTGGVAKKPIKKRVAEVPKKPASLTCKQSRWLCEYQTDTITIDITAVKQEVYIFGCIGATIIIKGKFKALTVDNCKKTNVVIDSVISTVEAVNSKSLKIQVLQFAPAVAVDKTDGYQLYLAKSSHSTVITSSKSSEMNANFEMEDGEWKEVPIPEQFVSNFAGGKLTTGVSDLYA